MDQSREVLRVRKNPSLRVPPLLPYVAHRVGSYCTLQINIGAYMPEPEPYWEEDWLRK